MGAHFQCIALETILPTLQLPPAPAALAGPVKAWQSPLSIPNWEPLPGERNPMFLEKRVYQGSSGRVYPLPFIDRIADAPVDRAWQAIHLENEYLRVLILPELGGRIHMAVDKTNGYDFVYRQDVIKPALVGLAGPWLSGGIEFNWPQHHRPGTYLPVEATIENDDDGSCTVWLSAIDPLSRMKGMHGVCLRPGKSCIELRVRLHNPTPVTQTFLWWANVATEVNEAYQSFFPEDVHYVADHAKRAISSFPLCADKYYGADYAGRAQHGVAEHEQPRQFRPDGTYCSYSANDLAWFANIPVPTSYMCLGTEADFFGGYDHKAKAGIVHVANHHIAPGKKQWCWGNHEFGYAWDRHLTEPDVNGVYRPYIELMAGVYTDNQPDFAFLNPGETRVFSQYWYPIRDIGPACQANADAAVSLAVSDEKLRVGVATTSRLSDARIVLARHNEVLADWTATIAPDQPFLAEQPLAAPVERKDLTLRVETADGREVIAYRSFAEQNTHVPQSATEPPPPSAIASADELFITGLHIDQYRHATRAADAYWREALRRDPLDARCNNALGFWHLRRGEWTSAEACFLRAIERLTLRNPNPADGEALYNLGVCLRYLGRDDDAYDRFYKATWNGAWRAAAYFALAEIDAGRSDWARALEHAERSLRHDTDHLNARNLKALVLRQLGRKDEAAALIAETLRLDPLDGGARWLAGQALACEFACDTQTRIDLAIGRARAGQYDDAIALLRDALNAADPGTRPLLHYYLAAYSERCGQLELAADYRARAATEPRDYCFPSRLEDLLVLEEAIAHAPNDAAAHYYLGNLLYDKRRHADAIAHWEASVALDPKHPTAWRNLGIGRFNILGDAAGARKAYERAFALDQTDARVLYERDQLWKRIGVAPQERLAELERHPELVATRDGLCVELSALCNHADQPERALQLLLERRFQPWEGGEGQALGQYVRTRLSLGRRALDAGQADGAVVQFSSALNPPASLGEARHLLANPSDILYWLGVAHAATGNQERAHAAWETAASFRGDFQLMSVRAYSELSYFSAKALAALGRQDEAQTMFSAILAYAEAQHAEPAKIDYFATSLPTMLLFEDDLQKRQMAGAGLIKAQALYGLGSIAAAGDALAEVLELDPNNAIAIDLAKELRAVPSVKDIIPNGEPLSARAAVGREREVVGG